MNFIDSFLNKVTMYKLVLYGLTLITVSAFVLSFFGMIAATPGSLGILLAILLVSSKLSNLLFSKLFNAPANIESEWITAFILFLTLAPPTTLAEGLYIAFGGIVAMASKYFLAIKKKHIFNPAAFALFILSVTGTGLPSWWVGAPALLPIVAIVGLLIVRKIRRFDVFATFVATSLVLLSMISFLHHVSVLGALTSTILSGPLVFFSTIMLTEPLTMPPTRPLRIVFALVVGGLFVSQFNVGPVFSTPELALLFGNLYAYLVSSKQKLVLALDSIERLSNSVYEFIFIPNQRLSFSPGQYLEWTMPHQNPDSRGNRRYFTIASSPTGKDLRLGIRFNSPSSSFKRALISMKRGDQLVASALAGDFTLPKDSRKKLVFIAGGVGITPFVSMFRYLLDRNQPRDIAMFYSAATEEDLAYRDLLEEARTRLGIHIMYLVGADRLTAERIEEKVSDFANRTFYLSGPNAMVESYKKLLLDIGVSRKDIHTDYFPGF